MTTGSTAPLRPEAAGAARRWPFAAAGFFGVMVLAALGITALAPAAPGRLLLAPMIGLDGCLFAASAEAREQAPALAAACAPEPSAAAEVERTLAALSPRRTSRDDTFELGYTLNLPLLKFMRPAPAGGWQVDAAAVRRAARTVADSPRPVVLYLFSNHFGSGAAVERELAADAGNRLQTQAGALGVERYFGITDLYPWSFVRTDNAISRMRLEVINALLGEVCALPPEARARIRGVTVLGELHQMFPHFESGMDFAAPYRITDYSERSVQDFRAWLRQRFGSIARLNAAAGTDFPGFDAVLPPSRDIRQQPLAGFWQHIDAYAAGVLPVTGWLHVEGSGAGPGGPAAVNWIRVYVDGVLAARVAPRLGRQDVLAAHPEFGTAEVGWRADLHFGNWRHGLHRIDVLAEHADGRLSTLATRQVAVMAPDQRPPRAIPARSLPPHAALPPAGVHFSADTPADGASYYYNPFAPLWHAFRAHQVRNYLAFFGRAVAATCIPRERVYAHQMVPFVNPGWDYSRFALEDDLDVPRSMALGVSLYGDAASGAAAWPWRRAAGHHAVTEFHPLRALDAPELGRVLRSQAAAGADFVSFFLEAADAGPWTDGRSNPLSLAADNPRYGSAALRGAVQQLMAR